MELTEAMTSMGLSGGQTVMSVDTYERVAPYLQDLAKPPQTEVSFLRGRASHKRAARDRYVKCHSHFWSPGP